MPTPAPSWNTGRVYGTWNRLDGTMRAGKWKLTIPVRVTNATDDVIIPAGVFAEGDLNVTPGVPSLDLAVPSNSDPDNSPNGWQPVLEVTFLDAAGEKYVIDVPVGGEVNLRTVVLAASIPVPQNVLIRGVPGGLAELDADGDVVDAAGDKVGGITEVTALAISDATTTGRSVLTAADAAAARTAIGAGTSSLAIGTTASTAKAGNYQPTAANISDSTAVGRSVVTAVDASAARTAIGAGTSNLALGTTSSTAKAGDYAPTTAAISDSTATGRALLTATDAAAGRTALAAAPTASPTFTGTVSGVTKTHVGLTNVDNTSDANKPVSTAQATALALRALKSETWATVVKSGGTWPARPTGWAGVVWVGADPDPLDMAIGDIRDVPAS